MTTGNSEQHGAKLSPQGEAAVDALIAARARGQASDDPQVRQLASLLGMLDAGRPARADALIDVTLARVAQVSHADQSDAEHGEALSHDDAEALDALATARWQASRLPSVLRARGERHEALLALAAETEVPRVSTATPPTLLIERTLAQIAQQRATLDPAAFRAEPSRGRWRWRELVSVAAVLFLGVSVLSPILAAGRARQMRVACASNMGGLAGSLGAYANDFQGSLPMASASLAGLPWWNVGKDVTQSNSANLFTVRRLGYAPIEQTACAGNDHAVKNMPQDAWDWRDLPDVSYSYFVMFTNDRPTGSSGAQTVLLADRSPVVLRAIRREPVQVLENSPNHAGSGQSLLRGDGSVVWASTPVHRGDNIWLPANLELALDEAAHEMRMGRRSGSVPLQSRQRAAELRAVILHGNEAPVSAQDSFVGP